MPPAYAVTDWSSLRMTLERQRCIGSCPYYRVEIGGDGTVSYEGLDCVAMKGKQTGHVDDAEVKKLFQMFVSADFWSLQDQYRGGEPDAPGYFVSLSFDGKSKRVLEYLRLSAGMPKIVQDIEDEIDRATAISKWLWGTRDCSGRTIQDH